VALEWMPFKTQRHIYEKGYFEPELPNLASKFQQTDNKTPQMLYPKSQN